MEALPGAGLPPCQLFRSGSCCASSYVHTLIMTHLARLPDMSAVALPPGVSRPTSVLPKGLSVSGAVASASVLEPGRASALQLPPELARFFTGTTPRTLCIRGAPGTGKTTLALEIADFLGARAVVASSVPRPILLEQFPWVSGSRSSRIEVLDLSGPDTYGPADAPRRERPEGTIGPVGQGSPGRGPCPSVQRMLRRILQDVDGAPKMLVIDSWEGCLQGLIGPRAPVPTDPIACGDVERTFLGEALARGSHVVIVAERNEPGPLDYVTDGALLLSSSEFEGREERWLSLGKLRGTRLENSSYPFTLEGGRFRTLLPVPIRPRRADPWGEDAPDPEPTEASLWPGSSAFARWFGRLLPARCTLLEADSETPEPVLWTIVSPMARATLRGGGRVVVRPPPSLSGVEVWEDLSRAAPTGALSTRLRIASPRPHPLPSGSPESVFFGPVDRLRTFLSEPEATTMSSRDILWREIADFLRDHGPEAGHHLVLAFPDTGLGLEGEGAPGRAVDPFLSLPSDEERAEAGYGVVLIMRMEDPNVTRLRARCTTHLLVRTFRGRLFLYGVRPWTPLLVPAPSEAGAEGAEPYGLLPVL